MKAFRSPPTFAGRRAWCCAATALLLLPGPLLAAEADGPQARAQRLLAAIGAQRYDDAARAFFFTEPPQPERVAALAHHLQALQDDLGEIDTAKPATGRPQGNPKRYLRADDAAAPATKTATRPTVLAYELDSPGRGPVQLVVTLVEDRKQWRVRSLGAYWTGEP